LIKKIKDNVDATSIFQSTYNGRKIITREENVHGHRLNTTIINDIKTKELGWLGQNLTKSISRWSRRTSRSP
jgi:hypothetical protein